MTQMPDSAAWARLGEHLQRRRLELDQRYANFTLFTDERGINYRVAWDAEHGARTNYRRQTLRQIETAYQLDLGWIGRFLDGNETPPAPLTVLRPPDALDDMQPAATPAEREEAARYIATLREAMARIREAERRGA